MTDFGCDYWCDDQSRAFWARDLGGRRSIERREMVHSGRRDLLLGSGVGGGDADEDGGPGAKRPPVLSELG